jgi:hypothetical protein
MSRVIKPYEARNISMSNGNRVLFFFGPRTGFGATTSLTAVLPNKVVKRHPRLCPSIAGIRENAACEPMAGRHGSD